MDNLNITISILTAILTGGLFLIFFEILKVTESVTNRFYNKINPFFKSFSSYVRFISFFKSCFTFKVSKDSTYINQLKKDVDEIASWGGNSILTGQDYSANNFTAKELEDICQTINDIWYCLDRKRNFVYDYLIFDSYHARIFNLKFTNYLEAISPEYKGIQINKDILAKVSGDFYETKYRPIQNFFNQYEFWQKQVKIFKTFAFTTIGFTSSGIILVILNLPCIQMWVYDILCIVCLILLLISLYKLIKIYNLSNKIIR